MKKIELLAPAKDLECGIAAINCGADAVYIGANKFGARSSVGNSIEDIEKLINFAHKYWAKVYITINTILNDNEIIEAQKLINKLYEIGADAVIIQDMGLLELELPPIPLFASTQTHNNSPQKVKFLEEAGFQRVILARELSLAEIKKIKSETHVDLESFVHGALCVSYSGQCYLSYAIGGRSGNRGECAQPCRKLYSLKDSEEKVVAKDRYLLSLKDLNLSEHIKDLIEAGITSFKIEGRLKDINYIKNVVSFYRKEIDKVLAASDLQKYSSGKSSIDFEPDPYKTFNRGFTTYFLNGRNKELASINTPKSIGEPVGKVLSVDNNSFTVKSSIKLNNGDGICFFDEKNILNGTVINHVHGNKVFPNELKSIKKGTFIYRNLDHKFLKSLETDRIDRRIELSIKLFEKDNDIFVQAVDEDGIKAVQKLSITKEIANNQDMALSNIKKQLAKLGDTEFVAAQIEVDLEKTYFIPVKTLNEIRRNLAEELVHQRIQEYPQKTYQIKKNNYPYPETRLTYQGNVLNSYSRKFYGRHGIKEIEQAAESGINMAGNKVMTTKYCLKYQFDLCPKNNKSTSSQKQFYLIDEYKKEYLLNFNCKNCEMEIIF